MKGCILLSAGSINLQSCSDKAIESTAGANHCFAPPGLDTGPTLVKEQSALPVADDAHLGLDVAPCSTTEQAAILPEAFYGSRCSRRPTVLKPSRYR